MKSSDPIRLVRFYWRLPSWGLLTPAERMEIQNDVHDRHAKGHWPKGYGIVKAARFEKVYQACWEVDA